MTRRIRCNLFSMLISFSLFVFLSLFLPPSLYNLSLCFNNHLLLRCVATSSSWSLSNIEPRYFSSSVSVFVILHSLFNSFCSSFFLSLSLAATNLQRNHQRKKTQRENDRKISVGKCCAAFFPSKTRPAIWFWSHFILLFSSTSLPLASTRWARLTISPLSTFL